MIVDRIALIIAVIGALNWGSIGIFQLDLVAWIFGGSDALLARIIYTVIGVAAVCSIPALFSSDDADDMM